MIQKYRDEVESDRKPGGLIVSTRVFAGNLPSSASEEQLCRLSGKHGEAALVSTVEAESPDQFRGLGGVDLAALEPALMQTPVERPVWVNGTLPGVMAGMRPAPRPVTQV